MITFRNKNLYIILFLLISTIAVGQSSALEKTIVLKSNKYSIYNILSLVSKQTKLSFSYDAKLIKGDSIIKIAQNKISIKEILNKICKNNNYELINDIVIINKKPDTLKTISKKKVGDVIKINGIITTKNGQPISYATISLKLYNIGTISNAQGNFALKVKKSHIDDTIEVNHIGYKPYKIAIKNIKKNFIKVKLITKLFTMQEIIIWSGNPMLLITKAYQKRKKNYYYKPFHIDAFYREIVTIKKKIKTVSEGIINVYRKNKNNFSKNEVKVIKSRKFYNYNVSDSIALKLQAGLSSIFKLDVAHQRMNFFSANSSELYDYKLSKLTTLNNENVAVITFSPKKNLNNDILFSGVLYIGINSKALLACDFQLSKNSIQNIGRNFILRKPRRIIAKLSSVKYFVLYSHFNNRYFLNHIFGELNFSTKKKGSIFSKKIKIKYELAVTKIDTSLNKPFKIGETTSKHRIFIEQISNNPSAFWEDYNIIKPNKSINKELKKLGVQIIL